MAHITSDPRNWIVIFGDGQMGMAVKVTEGITDTDNQEITRLIIMPSKEMIRHYDIRPEDYIEGTDFLMRDFKSSEVKILSIDPNNPVIFVFRTFQWGNTKILDLLYDRTIEEETLRSTINILQSHNAALQHKLNTLLTFESEYVTKMAELFKFTKQPNPEDNIELQDEQTSGDL